MFSFATVTPTASFDRRTQQFTRRGRCNGVVAREIRMRPRSWCNAWFGGSPLHQYLEPPVCNPLHVERRVVPQQRAETGVGRDLRVGLISLLA